MRAGPQLERGSTIRRVVRIRPFLPRVQAGIDNLACPILAATTDRSNPYPSVPPILAHQLLSLHAMRRTGCI